MFPMVLSLHKVSMKGKHHLNEPYLKLRSVEHNDYLLSTKDKQMGVLEIQKGDETIVKIRK